MATVIKSLGITGLNGYLVEVEISVFPGVAMANIVGLGDLAVREAKDRIESCFNQFGYTFPNKKIVINLSPADIKKSGTFFDLAMVIGILIESYQLKPNNFILEDYLFLGGIGLTGELKYYNGVLPMVIAAKKMGYKNIVLPKACQKEASLINGMELFCFEKISDVISFMEVDSLRIPSAPIKENMEEEIFNLDFNEVRGHKDIMPYILAAVSGNHNLLLIGPPGCGKSMIAKRIPGILPPMSEEEILEVTSIYSISGHLSERKLIQKRPFRSPHYNVSANALIGGGINAMPGEISLAHNGVLFLDELPEYGRAALESLRQPLEDRVVTVSRVRSTNTFPAGFQLVAAMNPCPCGHYGSYKCVCSPGEIKRYKNRISGPIMDRIDIQKYMSKIKPTEISMYSPNQSTKEMREIVEKARKIQDKRFRSVPDVKFNGQMDAAHIKEFCPLNTESQALLTRAYDKFEFSPRTYNKIIKIARTFADIDESEHIQKKHLTTALMARDLDKDKTTYLPEG